MHFKSSDGLDIYVGKNNKQNDVLTLKTSSSNDIWLHTKDIPGSHVIIKKPQNDIPDTTLLEAAHLAAYFSKAKQSSNVQVDYAQVRNVKKPSGAKPGMVIYENYRTLVVTPDENIIKKLG
jgi:predicted ribosome quality control (RQC) complex YloA/Tae2 family protein